MVIYSHLELYDKSKVFYGVDYCLIPEERRMKLDRQEKK